MDETTSLRWRAAASKTAVNYHTLQDQVQTNQTTDDKKDESTKKGGGGGGGEGRLCCGTFNYCLDGVAATAVASSILSWKASNNVLVKIASSTTFFFGPYVAYQRRKLQTLGELRTAQNELRSRVNCLQVEQEQFQRTLSTLDHKVVHLESVEKELHGGITGNSSTNVSRLVQMIQEQEEINKGLMQVLKLQVLQTILSVLLQSDSDGDFHIGAKEVQLLIVRLKMMDGVEFNETQFRALLKTNASLSAVMKIIRSLLTSQQQQLEETVFTLHPEQMTALQRQG